MSAYLGPLGGLQDLRCPTKLERSGGGVSHASWDTTTGRRVVAPVFSRRTWNLATSSAATPESLAMAEAFTYGGFGPGPFYFVPPDAIGANLLTPWETFRGGLAPILPPAPTGYVNNGSMEIPGVGGAPSIFTPSSLIVVAPPSSPVSYNVWPIPTDPAGGPITISAWVIGQDAILALQFVTNSGTVVSTFNSGMTGNASTWTRISVTATPPSTASAVNILMDLRTVRITGVQATWTDQVMPYSVGRGCVSAVLTDGSDSTTLAVPGNPSWGRMSALSYSVIEVG